MALTDTEVRGAARSQASSAACPDCGRRSSRVHCYHPRALADRSAADKRVRLELRARQFVCGNGQCDRRRSAGQIPNLTRRHARHRPSSRARAMYCSSSTTRTRAPAGPFAIPERALRPFLVAAASGYSRNP
ncbi:transposase family protein [Streptomyces sp. NPDC087218]|uniref:transposase family protein n=1 Tax=Streptomyces sp. NPDC087218 TaxID=3365769 RepID=UPI0037F55AEB